MNLDEVTYQGMTFPVDYGRKVLGELSDEKIEKYSEGVNDFRKDNKDGLWNNIFFDGNNVIRYLKNKLNIESFKRSDINEYLKNFFIGNDLKQNGLGIQKMKSVYWGDKNYSSFLVMNKLDLEYNSSLSELKREEIFNEQYKKILSLGYIPGEDTYCNQNFGIDKNGKSYFFDFDAWEIPEEFQIPQLNGMGIIE